MKRIICLIVATIMLFSCNVFAARYTDVEENSELGLTVEFLSQLGIINGYDDDTFRGEENITRGEFAVIVARMLKLPEQIDSSRVYYIDVPASHWAAGSIEQLTERKYLSGKGDGYFGINDKVTLEEACTVFLRICGYEPLATVKGGFPNGYTRVASDVRLLKNVTQTTAALSRNNAAMLIKNTLNLGMYSIDAIKNNGTEYSVSDDTILSVYWNMYHTEGILTAANGTNLFGGSDSTDSITIDDVDYEVNENVDYIDYLGTYVDAYYTDINDVKELYFIGISDRENTITKIQYDEIESVDDNYAVRYYDGNRTKTKKLNYNVKIIYNGVCLPSFTMDIFDIEYGYIELIETKSSGVSVVKIWNYETCYVTSVDSVKNYVCGKNVVGNIDLSDDNEVLLIKNRANENIDFSAISVKNVLTVARYGKTVRALLSEESFEISIQKIDSAENKITADEREYKIVPCYSDIFSKSFGVDNIKVYVDVFGNIAYAEGKNGSESSYAYIINGYKDDRIDEKIVLKLFTQDDKVQKLTVSEKVKIDGIRYKDIDKSFEALCINGAIKPQFVCIRQNSDGEIVYIDTPYVNSPEENEYTLSENIPFGSYRFKWNGSIGGKGVMNDSTIIFVVPTDDSVKNADDRDFSIVKRSNYTDNSVISLSSYKTSPKAGYEQVCVVKSNSSDGALNDALGCVVISKMSQALNSDDEVVTKIVGYTNGVEKEIFTTSDSGIETDSFNEGDVVRVLLNNYGEATSAVREVSVDDFVNGVSPNWAPVNDGNFDANYRKTFGVPYEAEGGILRVAFNLGDKWSDAYAMTGTYTLVDTTQSKNKVSSCTINDIHPYDIYGNNCDRIFIQGRASSITSVVVFR